MLTKSEQRVLRTFREYLMTPHQMLCFAGPSLSRHRAALKSLTDKEMLVPEKFKGAYSLTTAGYAAMQSCA